MTRCFLPGDTRIGIKDIPGPAVLRPSFSMEKIRNPRAKRSPRMKRLLCTENRWYVCFWHPLFDTTLLDSFLICCYHVSITGYGMGRGRITFQCKDCFRSGTGRAAFDGNGTSFRKNILARYFERENQNLSLRIYTANYWNAVADDGTMPNLVRICALFGLWYSATSINSYI
jgi:hypothetical protein